jgi:hypothetical protein
MKLLDLLRKYIMPTTLGIMATDGHGRQVSSHHKEISKIEQTNEDELKNIQEILWSERSVNEDFKVKLEANSSQINEVNDEISFVSSKIKQINS